MAKPDDKPTSFREWRDKLIPPEERLRVERFARRLQAEFLCEPDPDPDDPATPNPAPASTTPASSPLPDDLASLPADAPPASADYVPPARPFRRAKPGEQEARVQRMQRNAAQYGLDGKAPPDGCSAKAKAHWVGRALGKERALGRAPSSEHCLPDPSDDVVGRVLPRR